MRDNFPKRTIKNLAKRVGYLCSNPECQKPTVGAGTNKVDAIIIGVAAHITAASKGGKRYDGNLTLEQRKDIDNGIWLCQNCAKLIDSDVNLYTIEILNLWKGNSEQKAHKAISSTTSIGKNQKSLNSKLNKKVRDEKIVSTYKESFVTIYKDDIKNFIPVECTIDEQNMSSDLIFDIICSDTNFSITGQSGYGKSLLSKQCGVQFALLNGVPVYLEAKYFDSSIILLLDKEINSLSAGESAVSLFSASNRLGQNILVIIDGYNECNISLRKKLIHGLLSIQKQNSIKVIIVSQFNDDNIDQLNFKNIQVNAPSFETKKAIVLLSAENKSILSLEPIIVAVNSGMEAKIIGEIMSQDILGVSRFRLFDFFIRKKLAQNATDAIWLLSIIGNFLSDKISFSLTTRDIEQLLRKKNINFSIVESLIEKNILKRYFDKISFCHELFLNAFIAGGISNYSNYNDKKIIEALNAPKNYDKKVLIIGAIDDNSLLQKVLDEIDDPSVIISIFNGDAGIFSKQWAENRIGTIIQAIYQESESIKFEIKEDPFNNIFITENTLHQWTPQESSFIDALPELLYQGLFLEDIFHAISLMENNLEKSFKLLLQEAKEKKIALRSDLFAAVYVPFTRQKSTLGRIISSISSGFHQSNSKFDLIKNFLNEITKNGEISNGQLFFILDLVRFSYVSKSIFNVIKQTIQKRWKYLPYHLKSNLLNHVAYCCDTEDERKEMIDVLNSLPNENGIMLSSHIIDSLKDLGALDIDAHEHEMTVQNELQQIFQNEDDPNAWKFAFSIYSRQYDHPYEITYCNVINSLNADEKKKFYRMAIQGTDIDFFVISLIIEYTNLEDVRVCKYIKKWQQAPNVESHYPDEEFKLFFFVHILLAKYNFEISSLLNTYDSKISNALCASAEILYWVNRTDLEMHLRKKACLNAWKYLSGTAASIAVECLWKSEQGLGEIYRLKRFSESTILRIGQVFPEEIVKICRATINSDEIQETIFRFDKIEYVKIRAIQMLEYFGNLIDIPFLKTLVENPEFGRSAVNAIKVLEGKP